MFMFHFGKIFMHTIIFFIIYHINIIYKYLLTNMHKYINVILVFNIAMILPSDAKDTVEL